MVGAKGKSGGNRDGAGRPENEIKKVKLSLWVEPKTMLLITKLADNPKAKGKVVDDAIELFSKRK